MSELDKANGAAGSTIRLDTLVINFETNIGEAEKKCRAGENADYRFSELRVRQ